VVSLGDRVSLRSPAWTYLLLTLAFLQQFADLQLFGPQVVSQVVVLLLRLVDQLVEVRRLLLDLTGFILRADTASTVWARTLTNSQVMNSDI